MVDDRKSAFNWQDPGIDWEKLSSGHLVHVYDNEGFFIQTVAVFLSMALRRKEAAVLIATEEHRASLEQWLAADGLDLGELERSGQFVCLDARETLKKFMVDGAPDKALFFKEIGSVISKADGSWAKVRAFGEMVTCLWAEGNHEGAIALEELWNQLGKIYSFTLLCAYPKMVFNSPGEAHAFSRACLAHSTIIL